MKVKLLFVCEGNTCRSPLAQYLTQKYYGDRFSVDSAGYKVRDKEVNSKALNVMKNEYQDNEIYFHIPRDIEEVLKTNHFDFVIAMDTGAYTALKEKVKNSSLLNWNITDPYQKDYEVYRQTSIEIKDKIEQFVNSPDVPFYVC